MITISLQINLLVFGDDNKLWEVITINLEWYVNLMNMLDERAKENRPLNGTEITQLNICVNRYAIAGNATELIHDIADANDCGECNSWNELIAALHQLFVTGERIALRMENYDN